MIEVIFTPLFKRKLKSLAKRYRSIKKDIQPVIDELGEGNLLGDQLSGVSVTAFKLRVKNSDIPTGKSGGYRLIYQVHSPESVFLLMIYAKSDRADVDIKEIEEAARLVSEE